MLTGLRAYFLGGSVIVILEAAAMLTRAALAAALAAYLLTGLVRESLTD